MLVCLLTIDPVIRVSCNKKAHPEMHALSVIRLRHTGKACAPLVHLSVCASGAFERVRLWCKRRKISVGKLATPNLALTLILLPLLMKDTATFQ